MTKAKKSIERKKPLLKLRFLFFFLLGVVALYFFSQSSFFNLQQVTINGTKTLKVEEIKGLTGVSPGMNLWKIKVDQVRNNILLHPVVLEAVVARKFPSSLVITIEERTPLALLPTPKGFLQIDQFGVYMQKIDVVTGLTMPMITGLELHSEPLPGKVVVATNLDLALKVIDQLSLEARNLIAEIDVREPTQLLLYTKEGIQIKFGTADRIAEKSTLITSVCQQVESKPEYIDVSSGTAFIKYQI